MSQSTPTQTKSPPRPPDYDVVCVRPITRDGAETAVFTRIGSAWARDRGGGFSVRLEAHPIGDRFYLLERREPEAAEYGPNRQEKPS